jgi:4-carboxymuconolactone decarboxylase
MGRIPAATRETVPSGQADAFDQLLAGAGSVPLVGPGSIFRHVPKAQQLVTALNQYLRNDSSLSNKILELAMLVTARENDCMYVWNAHATSARAAGVPDAVVDALRDRKELPALALDEAAVINYGQEFYRTHRVSRGAFQSAIEQFGKQGLIELTLTMGNYALIAITVTSFDSELPANRTEPVLPV